MCIYSSRTTLLLHLDLHFTPPFTRSHDEIPHGYWYRQACGGGGRAAGRGRRQIELCRTAELLLQRGAVPALREVLHAIHQPMGVHEATEAPPLGAHRSHLRERPQARDLSPCFWADLVIQVQECSAVGLLVDQSEALLVTDGCLCAFTPFVLPVSAHDAPAIDKMNAYIPCMQ